jgi:hypothetical protein
MKKPISIRLSEDSEKFVESMISEETTKTDVIEACIRNAKENVKLGKQHTPEMKISILTMNSKETAKIEEALKEINKGMRDYYCEDWELLNKKLAQKRGSGMPLTLSELPCIQNPAYDCKYAKRPNYATNTPWDNCPLFDHKEWRELIAKHLAK